ncbi:MAG: acyl-CoA dehydrogenase family protein [Acidimicrobiia bacterium]
MWDFETEPEFQEKLDWARHFVDTEVEPLDLLWPHDGYKSPNPQQQAIIAPLKQQVKDHELWACHLTPELGGRGYGQLKLALLNEILGRCGWWAPRIFGTQAPDTGNAEILAHYGTEEQKAAYLQPLLEGDIVSSYSMTEPQGGSDPGVFTLRAQRDGDEWVINGMKFFSSNARYAKFLIVMAVTNPDVGPYNGISMFVVPADTPGVNIVRNIAVYGEPDEEGSHGLVEYDNVRVPLSAMLGGEGQGFQVAQTRLGGGRVHHAMRAVGMCSRALDMMCERALSRHTKGSLLADKQAVQGYIADSWMELQQFRLFVLQTAWKIDKYNDYNKVRADIAASKIIAQKLLHDIIGRSIQVHGALGASNELNLCRWWMVSWITGFSDGPSEIHKRAVSRQVLKDYSPAPGLWPTEHLPTRRAEARVKLGIPG